MADDAKDINSDITKLSLNYYIKLIGDISQNTKRDNTNIKYRFTIEEVNKLYKKCKNYCELDNKFILEHKLNKKLYDIGSIKNFNDELNRIYDILLYSRDDNKIKLYYRGHYSEKYHLLPSVFREDRNREEKYYNEILTRCPNEFEGKTHLQKLVKMQHYECPTRLLDVTTNPLVALYFACKNYNCPKCDDEKTGEVLIFAVKESNILRYDSDKALIISCLPKFSSEFKYNLYSYCLYAIIVGKTKLFDDGISPEIGRLYHEIRREVSAFRDCLDPWDVLSIFLVQPYKDNNRIIKQDGAFIICGEQIDNNALENMLNTMLIQRIKIQNKTKILKQLDALGINEATLFPEIDKVAHYLKEN